MPIMTATEVASSPNTERRGASSAPRMRHCTALDGLRGVAILAVMLYHFSGGYKGPHPALRLWSLVADAGWIGVDLFFALSGFLITGILYETACDEQRVKNFYARRSLRIFPLFYFVLIGLLLLTPILKLHWHWENLLYFVYLSNMAVLFVPNFHLPSQWVNLGHLWSLAVEEQFYLFWPWVVWWVRRKTALLWIIVAVLITVPVLRGVLFAHGTDPSLIGRLLLTRADSLLFGAGAALLARSPSAKKLPAGKILLASVAALALVLDLSHGADPASAWICVLGYSLIAAASASVIFLAQQGSGWLPRLIDRKLFRFFGRYSYGLYLFHGLYFVYLRHLSGKIEAETHSGLLAHSFIIIVGFALSIALAVLSYHFFEAPILKLKARFS